MTDYRRNPDPKAQLAAALGRPSPAEAAQDILALDLATRCGYAHSDGRHGVWNLGAGRDDSEKLHCLAMNIKAMAPLKMIAVELASYGAAHRKGQGVQWSQIVWQNAMLGVVKQVASEIGAKVEGFHPSSIKKMMTDNGRATKQQVRQAVKRLLGIETVDDNDSDAVAILTLAKRPDCWAKKAAKPKRAKGRGRATKKSEARLFR